MEEPANIRACDVDRPRIRVFEQGELRIDLKNYACYLTKLRIHAFWEEKPQTFTSARKKNRECVCTIGKIGDVAGTKNL